MDSDLPLLRTDLLRAISRLSTTFSLKSLLSLKVFKGCRVVAKGALGALVSLLLSIFNFFPVRCEMP